MKRIIVPAFLALLVIYIVWPLLRPGFIPTHDGEFSIIRIWQYAKLLRTGDLFPRWAPDVNSGYGLPLFTFYYPLPYFFGSLLHIAGISLADSFKVTLAFSYFAGAAFCYLWLKKLAGRFAAASGTALFLTVPYAIVNLYIRGSVGESMAMAFVVGVLAGVEYQRPRLSAVAVAGLILSHNISAMLFLPLLSLYVFYRQKSFMRSIFLGFVLSAFFWIPAIFEQKFVSGLSNFDFRDHFVQLPQLIIPSWGSGFSRPGWPADEMSQQAGLGVWLALAFSVLLLRTERNIFWRNVILSVAGISILVALSVLGISESLWETVRPLRFVQYPWRLLGVFIPLSGILGAYVARRSRRLALLIIGIGVGISIGYVRPVVYESRPDTYYLTRREFTDGTTSVGNSFTTRWLHWQPDRPESPFEEVFVGSATIRDVHTGPTSRGALVSAKGGTTIAANVSYYPGWRLFIDNQESELIEAAGRIEFSVPAGDHRVSLVFAETRLRLASNLLSILGLFWLCASAILSRTYARGSRRNSLKNRA